MKSLIGRNGIFNRLAIATTTLGLVCHGVGNASAQNVIGSNASPYPGNCPPGTPYGFFKPHWRQWPGAVYPDTVIPKPASEEISPPNVQLPGKDIESQIQATPTPAQQRSGGNSSDTAPAPNDDTTPDAGGVTPQIKPLDEPGGLGCLGWCCSAARRRPIRIRSDQLLVPSRTKQCRLQAAVRAFRQR